METAVCELDIDGHVRRWGDAAQRTFGWTKQEAIGALLPMVPFDLREEVLEALRASARGEGVGEHPTIWQRRDGSPLEVAVSMSGLSGGNGSEPTVVVIARDISERRLEQAQLEAYAKDVRESFGRELRRARELEASYFATVRALAAAVEAKDGYTGGHIQRVHTLGLVLARALVPHEADDPQLAYGCLLHDVGKLTVPDAVLGKDGPLTDSEWILMRHHPEAGARILTAVPFLGRAVDIVLHHHERWDGGGYPAGLSGEAIPRWARIFAVVDTLDALTSDRPYRSGRSLDAAIDEIAEHAGGQFEPEVTEALADLDRRSLQRIVAGGA